MTGINWRRQRSLRNRDKLETIAKALLEFETLDGSQLKEIVEHGRLINPPPGVAPPPTIKSLANWMEGAIQRFRSGVKNSRVIELHNTCHYVFIVDEALVVREMRKFLLDE